MYQKAIEILNKINELNYEAYIVGGYARDSFMNKKSTDIDICTNAPINLIKTHFNVVEENKFASLIILYDSFKYEITAFRKDSYEDTRYPKVSLVNTLKEDILRRDFTINTLCIDKNENYVDLLDARKDILLKKIKCVKDSKISIIEDPLRIIRAIRFSADLDFKIDDDLLLEIKNNKELLNSLSNKVIEKELKKVKNKKQFNNLINELDLNDYLF